MSDPHRVTDEGFLEYTRQQKCAVCLSPAPNDPHHLTSRGAGGSDLTAIPLCRDCHRRYHDLGHEAFQSHRSIDLWKQAHRHLRRYLTDTQSHA
jgi:hypothetical protein